MSNSVEDNPQTPVTDSENPQRSSPTRRVAAYHSDLELRERSQAFIEVMKQVDRVSNTNLPVLLIGESGTVKHLVASAIHLRSVRSDFPFIALNCAAIPADLIEAKLFGQPAEQGKRCLWEEANGGTIFLDEITETDPSFQSKLLRTMQTGEIDRAGSDETQKVDVRVIAATNRNVEEEVAAGKLLEDLFQQLNAISIVLPPLQTVEVEPEPATSEPGKENWVTLSEIEGRYVARVLEHTGGNKQAAARVLSVDRKTLDRMIKRHHIEGHAARGRAAKLL